ncbi:helix-turn-helix domain-containing protein [Actinocorallia aurantiaca]|uniref:TetR/AcrR family transcriptional regulator n=1 Tax=Actinocorallia aurantiaca TaxID=46204 RepID=A0ABN3TVX3_9ACTN
MARPRTHDLDRLLDVAEELVAEDGLEKFTVRRLSAASGMSNGAVYHAFGSVPALLGRTWLRAGNDFLELQTSLVDAALTDEGSVAAVVAAADAPAEFTLRRPAGARMLMSVRSERLLGPQLPEEVAEALLGLDRRLVALLVRLSEAVWGRRDAAAVGVITTCVVDLPVAFFRRVLTGPSPGSVEISDDRRRRLEAAVRAVLTVPPPDRGHRPPGKE